MLHNIISNACKYNKQNGSVILVSQGTSLSISDTGIGINQPQKVFERNYTEHLSGFGIGLDIVKRLCEHMNITIEVSSSDKGTEFILDFK
ncbi:ATP-binding protein [Sulfurimonas sp. MAG313]|nr:ATP-binding protein [Sulfurimonas sp. MAG313]